MKKELKLGKMTQTEISEWFGLKPDTFRKASDKSRSKKLRILKTYADYHINKRSIIIDKINIPVYSSTLEIIDEKFDETWSETGIDTCKRVNLDLCYRYSQIPAQVDESTSYNYVLKVKTRKYGRNSVDEFGEEGYCEYVWCKFGEKGELEILTEEQQKIISECAKKLMILLMIKLLYQQMRIKMVKLVRKIWIWVLLMRLIKIQMKNMLILFLW